MPTLSEVHADQALTDFSVGLFQDLGGSVASQLFSNRGVGQQSGVYYVYTAADIHRADAQRRAPNTESVGIRYGLSTQPYHCDVWAVHDDVSEQTIANADPALDPEEDSARVVTEDLMITEDREFAATAFVTSVWDTNVTGGTDFTQWDDAASTPIENIRVGIKTILQNTGKKPNKLGMGFETWSDGLADHPDILDRIKYTERGSVSAELLASLLGLDRVVIADSIRNTAQEGLAETAAFTLGDNAVLLHAPDNVGLRTPTAGVRFNWSGLVGGTQGIRMKRMEIPHRDAFPRVEGDMAFDHNIVTSSLGYMFLDTTA